MKRHIISLLLILCAALPTLAQRVTGSFQDAPLSEVLLLMERQCEGIQINFIYDDLKDYRVTHDFENVSLKEALHVVVGERPIRVVRKKNKYYLSIVPTPKLKISGKVQDGFLHQGVPGLKVALCRTDSTEIMDSLPMSSLYRGNNVLSCHIYSAEIKAQDKQYLIHTMARGYGDRWKKVNVDDEEDGEVNVPDIDMLKVFELKEVDVVATRIKMYYKGDTLVYDATAFKLPDGSMLDELIRQLPGVELKDNGEIFVNGRKVDELLLGSRSFMHGNRKVLLENLPYYTVKDLKVYEKATDMDEALGYTDGPKRYVMDVNLKEEYQVGYIANVEAAAGTNDRWLGRGFLLGFTKRWRYSVMANANNVDERQHIGESGNWSPQKMPKQMATVQAVKAEADYANKDRSVRNTLYAEYTHSDNNIDMHSRRETFLDGMTPLSLTQNATNNKSHWMKVREDFMMTKPTFIDVQSEVGSFKVNGFTQNDFQQYDDTLTTRMLTSGMDERWNRFGFVRSSGVLKLKKKKAGDIVFSHYYSYNRDDIEQASEHRIDRYAASSVTRNANDIFDEKHETDVSALYRRNLGKKWRFYGSLGYKYKNTKAHDYLYHADSLALPSQLESLTAFIDPHNSYDSRYTQHGENIHLAFDKDIIRPFSPGINIVSEGLRFSLDVPLQQQSLDYQRGAIDTLARRNTVYFNPSVSDRFFFDKDKRNEMRVSAGFTTHELDLLQTIAYRDDSQPLVVNLGNADLKARQSASFTLSYANHNGPHRQEVSYNSSFNYSVRSISQSLTYNPSTSVYTYQPVNIHGGYTWSNDLNYSRFLDEKQRWTVQSNADATLHHSVDHTMFEGETASHLNTVNNLTVSEKAYIQYNKDALNLRATGSISWRHSEGKMLDFDVLNAFDYQYGLNGRYTIPKLKTTLSVDANMYSCRGYGSSDLNTDDFVLNASLSQPFLKGKLIARIEAFDLLHNLSNTQYAVNAQGRTITWYRSLPHYAMLHLVYHWNKNPKKK
ncbi:MAG: hypothetical protein KBT39_11910 [Bacteroidales bacterium]|nr:hypothetical protein [Bacteroidales bacterium]